MKIRWFVYPKSMKMKVDIVTQVVQMVGAHMSIKDEIIFRPYPYGRVRYAQSLVFYTLKMVLGIPYNHFYQAFGHVDHTTVMRRAVQYQDDAREDQQTREDINHIINQIKKLSNANLLHYYGNPDRVRNLNLIGSC